MVSWCCGWKSLAESPAKVKWTADDTAASSNLATNNRLITAALEAENGP
jgi:hypothetical protein